MWNDAPLIFEDEDEAKLLADFVTFSARYPDRNPFEIAAYVFRNQRDPELRAQQAAMIWIKDLEVLERIRLAKLNGGAEALTSVESKEVKLRKLEAIYNDATIAAKDRIKAMELHAQIQGEIVKAVDKNVTTGRRQPRQVIYAQYDD